MKTLICCVAAFAACACLVGCFTSAVALTERTHPDGTVTVSRISVIGTGDRASQVAAEGMFADGTLEDLGAGVKHAAAAQESTGIQGAFAGMGSLLQGMSQFVATTQGFPVAGRGAPTQAESAPTLDVDPAGPAMFGATPGPQGEGVYGRPSCSLCVAYSTRTGVALVNLDVGDHRATMWNALRRLGHAGGAVQLPVRIAADGFTVGVQ